MPAQSFEAQPVGSRPAASARRQYVAGGLFLAAVAAGWFLISWLAAHNDVGTAVNETFGVVLAVLVVVSMIGAIRGRGHGERGDGGERREGGKARDA